MIDQNSQFFAILTNIGVAKQANADALGVPWQLTEMGVGDANGTDPLPDATQTRLINERRRAPLNQLKVDPANAAIIIAEQVIPAEVGGWWIREIGLFDGDGDLVAVANCAPSFKPLLNQGSGRTQVVRINLLVSNSSNVQLKIDPSVVLATRKYVDDSIISVLPPNKAAGTYRRVTINSRGVVVDGSNPATLADNGITDAYTKAQVDALIALASTLPVGAQVSFPVNKIPPGFLERDGSVQSVSAYPDLATYLEGAFNRGDEGAGNFRLPESRGEFERGWDHGRGVDVGRIVGSSQSATEVGTDNGRTVGVRPRNIAVVMCIKAWNAPINQGNIDIAALASLAAQASETRQGTAKLATQASVQAGADDLTIVTPKKLRFGFATLLASTGYIALPSWLGGVIIQWGITGIIPRNTTGTHTLPIAFGSVYQVLACFSDGASTTRAVATNANVLTTSQFTVRNPDTAGGSQYRWIAIGK
jgi:microcystin-dependent protein